MIICIFMLATYSQKIRGIHSQKYYSFRIWPNGGKIGL